jgi:hypothetical protein
MPRGDRTGPEGTGPMTGRGAGYCAGYDVPGYMNSGPGRGFGRGLGYGGWGHGHGWRHWYHATGLPGWARFPASPWSAAPEWGVPPAWGARTKEQEAEGLRGQAEWLQEQLNAVQHRINELREE